MKKMCLIFFAFGNLIIHAQKSKSNSSERKEHILETKKLLAGSNNKSDIAFAVSRYHQYANEGNTEAMLELGHIYKYGIYAERNIPEAILWFNKAAKQNNAEAWYNLGSIYKESNGQTRDFEKAYRCFENGAKGGDLQSIYAQGYMLFKGLGVKQDYTKAFTLFSKSAEDGNSAYFLGLCYRNGYGVTANEQTAKYWLNLAIQKGNYLAKSELKSSPENSNADAAGLAEMYKKVSNTTGNGNNMYKRLDNVPSSFLAGKYSGHIIRYDWSGKHAINSSTLALDLAYTNGTLTGTWREADTLTIPLTALATPNSLLFKDMEYAKKDHYSPIKAMPYRFENAKITWVKKDGETMLQGNISMFSVKRNEPDKPINIFLKKTADNNDDTTSINLVNEDGSSILLNNNIMAFPNPFDDVVTLNFKLISKARVVTKLLTADGKLLYRNDAGVLQPGYYSLPVKPAQKPDAGLYLLRLEYGNYSKTIKIVKR